MGYLKGKSAMMIFNRHTNLKYRFSGNSVLCKYSWIEYNNTDKNKKTRPNGIQAKCKK